MVFAGRFPGDQGSWRFEAGFRDGLFRGWMDALAGDKRFFGEIILGQIALDARSGDRIFFEADVFNPWISPTSHCT